MISRATFDKNYSKHCTNRSKKTDVGQHYFFIKNKKEIKIALKGQTGLWDLLISALARTTSINYMFNNIS